LTGALKAFAAEHLGLCELVSVGKSREGRRIWLAEITNRQTGPAAEKPAFWVDGNTHAGEVTGSMCALYLIQTLLESHGEDDLITRLLDEQTFYVLPRLSPDGAERYLTTPHTLRASTRPWPELEDEPGLHAEDLDGDGHIVQMRVEDPNGEWKKSDKDERLMVPRKPDGSGGTYYRLYKEGIFRDYDGFERKIARPLYGLDMNRQYSYGWREEHEQRGAGPYPLSEPEARSQVEALLARKNVFSVHTYHTFCGAILRPFSDKDDLEMPEQDLAVLKTVSERGTELTGYPNISVYHDFRYAPNEVITGTFDDWAYSAYGAMELLVDKNTGAVYPEPGPNMMWNTKYGMMFGGSGGGGPMMGPGGQEGMMGRSGPDMMQGGPSSVQAPQGATPGDEMPVNAERATQIADDYLSRVSPGTRAREAERFYGYHTLHTEKDGEITGMLGVNGYSGEVWYHSWHGPFMAMEGED
jgi:hypothetical protein